jgi:hypothetical protein
MAATLLGERAQDRERVATPEEVTYRRIYIVQTTLDTDGPLQVAFATGIPLINQTYRVLRSGGSLSEEDATVRVVSRKCQPITGSHRLWAVEVMYSSKHGDPEQDETDTEDLETEPPAMHFGFETKVVPVEALAEPISMDPLKGANAIGATTSAGEPFDPPPEYETSRPVLTITQNELVINPAFIREYQDAINSDNFLDGPPLTVRCRIEADRQYRKGFRYWRVTYNFVFEEKNWDLKVLNRGTYYLDRANGNNRKHFVTDDDPPQPRFGLLADNGDALNEADPPTFIVLPVYKRKPFAALPLRFREL